MSSLYIPPSHWLMTSFPFLQANGGDTAEGRKNEFSSFTHEVLYFYSGRESDPVLPSSEIYKTYWSYSPSSLSWERRVAVFVFLSTSVAIFHPWGQKLWDLSKLEGGKVSETPPSFNNHITSLNTTMFSVRVSLVFCNMIPSLLRPILQRSAGVFPQGFGGKHRCNEQRRTKKSSLHLTRYQHF